MIAIWENIDVIKGIENNDKMVEELVIANNIVTIYYNKYAEKLNITNELAKELKNEELDSFD